MRHLISLVGAHNSHGRLRQILDPLLGLLLLDGLIVGDCLDLPSQILTGLPRVGFDNMTTNDVMVGGTTATASALTMEGGGRSEWWMAVEGCGWAVLDGAVVIEQWTNWLPFQLSWTPKSIKK